MSKLITNISCIFTIVIECSRLYHKFKIWIVCKCLNKIANIKSAPDEDWLQWNIRYFLYIIYICWVLAESLVLLCQIEAYIQISHSSYWKYPTSFIGGGGLTIILPKITEVTQPLSCPGENLLQYGSWSKMICKSSGYYVFTIWP